MRHYNAAYPLKSQRERRKNERKNPKPWILPWLEDACARKNLLYHYFVKEPTTANKTVYDKMEAFCAKHVDLAKGKYYKKYFEEYKDNSRKQWEMINTLLNRRKKRVHIKKLIDKKGNIVDTPTAIANNFNNYFANIAANLKSNDRNIELPNKLHEQFLKHGERNELNLYTVRSKEVYDSINKFKNKATLDTKIGALKIANTSRKFTEVLAGVIDKSFREGVFPRQLKSARVVPVYKEGTKTDVENYRPISLLSSISKIYEKLMHNRVIKFLDENESLHDMQYGFRPGRSCEHALLKAQDELLDSLNKRQVSILLLIDFSKAFDMVEHDILIDKLHNYGIRGTTLQWFKSYLSDRTQFVTIDGVDSDIKHMEYGVPQGSILGPLLFIIYINDIPQISNIAKFILYADDANIIISGSNIAEANQRLISICDKLVEWVTINGLALNLKKTKYMIFSRQNSEKELPNPLIILGQKIEQEHEARFLGVIVDENFTWARHISSLRTKMARYIGIMYKLKHLLPLKTRIQIYHSFVQSHINYCSLVWGFCAKSHIETIFRAQKKGMRAVIPGYIQYRYMDGVTAGHTKPFFNNFGILTVQGVIVTNSLLFMHKQKHFPLALPRSVKLTIASNAPVPGSNHDTNLEWLSKYNNHVYRNSLFFKGPLLSVIPEFADLITPPNLLNFDCYKKDVKKLLLSTQAIGNDEWCANNFRLYNIPGLRKTPLRQAKIENVNYYQHQES